MKFVKGAIVGTMVATATAAAIMTYKDMNRSTRNKMIKKGKQFARKMGMM